MECSYFAVLCEINRYRGLTGYEYITSRSQYSEFARICDGTFDAKSFLVQLSGDVKLKMDWRKFRLRQCRWFTNYSDHEYVSRLVDYARRIRKKGYITSRRNYSIKVLVSPVTDFVLKKVKMKHNSFQSDGTGRFNTYFQASRFLGQSPFWDKVGDIKIF
jgi:hypothetical protein